MNVVAIIQARMGSSRLPGKVMLPIAGGCILQTVVERVHAAKRVDRVVVATSMTKADAVIANFCYHHDIICHRGSEADVLDRVYQAAIAYGADVVVDITADCPLVDPRHIDNVIGELLGDRRSFLGQCEFEGAPDYASNCIERDWPDGLDVQAATMDALRKVWLSKAAVREHVLWNVCAQASEFDFTCHQTMAPRRYRRPEWGLTLDEPADYALLKRLFSEMLLKHGNNLFPVESALDFLLAHPDMLGINAGVKRKEPGK